jgi:hypothetical protein
MTFIGSFIGLQVSLIPATVAASGLGAPLYVAIESTTPISGDITSVANATDVATLLAATQISAQAATDLTAMFAQDDAPALVYVATYDAGSAETPDDALDRAEAAELDFGPIAQESRSDTNNELLGAWVAASAWRLWSHPLVLQSATAGLIASGKPAGLADCEISACFMHYHGTSGQPQAAAHCGEIGGFAFAQSPMAIQKRILGVTLPSLTSAQRAFAIANDVCTLNAIGAGASASQRIIQQTRTYSGDSGTSVLTLMYVVRRCVAALQSVVQRHAISGVPLFATAIGSGEVRSAVATVLAELAGTEPPHFTSGTASDGEALPDGWRVETTVLGSEITATVTLLLGQEATRINLSLTGEVQ